MTVSHADDDNEYLDDVTSHINRLDFINRLNRCTVAPHLSILRPLFQATETSVMACQTWQRAMAYSEVRWGSSGMDGP